VIEVTHSERAREGRIFDVGAREQAAQAELAAEVKEWLAQHKLESVGGGLLQLGVETVGHLYMIEEKVRAWLNLALTWNVAYLLPRGLSDTAGLEYRGTSLIKTPPSLGPA
jgi:hypothetical protein